MNERVAWIDAVKGLAILMIFCVHMEIFLQLCKNYEFIQRLIFKGILGVELTFIVNAYLLCSKYESIMKNSIHYRWGGVLKYSILRIIPIYWLACIIFVVYNQIGLLNEAPSILNIISHFLLLHGMNPKWWATFPGTGYMSVLFLMWLIFPLYKRFVNNFSSALLGFAIVYGTTVLVSLGLGHVLSLTRVLTDYVSYVCRAIQSFALGVLLFYLSLKKETFNNKTVAIALMLISLISCGLLFFTNCGYTILYTVFLFLFVFSLSVYPIRLFVNPVFVFLGKYIFGIYLFHILLYYGLSKIIINPMLLLPTVFVLSIFLSVISNRFYEGPVIKFLKEKL